MAPGRKRNGGPSEAAEIKKAAKEAGPSSLFIFSEKNRLRELCRFTIVWLHFEHTIFMTVVASCIVQLLHVFEKNLPQHNKTILVQKLEATEIYFLAIFCVEAAIKIIALGFVLHRGSYLRDVWNAVDFFVLVTGWAVKTLFKKNKVNRLIKEKLSLKTAILVDEIKRVTYFLYRFITAFPQALNMYIDMRMLRAIRCVLRLITVQTNLRYIEWVEFELIGAIENEK